MTIGDDADEVTYDDNFVYLSVELLDFLGFRSDLGEVGFDRPVERTKVVNNQEMKKVYKLVQKLSKI